MSIRMADRIRAWIMAGIMALGAPAVLFAEPPAVDYKAIEELLKKVTANQPVLSLEISQEVVPSPIPGLQQVSFTVEMNGRRQKGVVYVSGSKVILGQIIDLASQQNLTALEVGIVYIPGIPKVLLVSALCGLALVKAALVGLYYMHLIDETKILRLSVVIPMAAPAIYAFVLIAEAAWRLT